MNLYDRNQKVRAFFNEKIDSYDEVHSSYMDTKAELANNLDKDAKRILDLGAGTGLELIHLFEMFPNAEVTVIDITENMLEKLKQRDFAKHVNTICGDFFDVEFGKDYDAVISTSALHHFKREEKLRLYKKVLECLKENGQFINSDFVAESEDVEKSQLNELENEFDLHKHIDIPITVEHEVEILKEVGFEDIETIDAPKHSYCTIKARRRK